MKKQITIREAVTENDVAAFWEQLHAYHKRDIFPDSDKEDLEYFLGQAYRDHMMNIYGRPQNRCFFLFFHRGGQDIGFAMPVIFTTEDGKCFIMEFCVYPEFRGSGTGKACAGTLLYWAKEHGARYAELNYGGNERRRHFWESMGFIENGADEWGEPLMLLPPEENFPITAKLLADPDDWQLKNWKTAFSKRSEKHRQRRKSRNSWRRPSGMGRSRSLWQGGAIGQWGCAVYPDAFPPSPAPMLGYSMTFTLNLCSAKRRCPATGTSSARMEQRKRPCQPDRHLRSLR